MHELFSAPFGPKVGLINFIFQLIELIAKPISLACGCSAICMPVN